LSDEIDRGSENTKYNGVSYIGSEKGIKNIQVGYNDGDRIAIETYDVGADKIGVKVNNATTTSDSTDKSLVALKTGSTYLDISQTLTAESIQKETVTTGTISTYSGNTVVSDGTTTVTVANGSAPANVAAVVTGIQGGTGYASLNFTVAAASNGTDIEFTWKTAGAKTGATFTQAGASDESIATTTAGSLVNKVPGALEVITGAIEQVAGYKASWGAGQNRLEYTVSNLMNVVEFTTAARSRIQDADFAMEAAKLAKAQVLQQTGAAMLAQANAAPQLALQLIK
jgi:flagellin